MPRRLEDLLRDCTVRVMGPNPGAGFFVARGKVLTCCHVISRDGTEAGVVDGIRIIWQRDGYPEIPLEVTGRPMVLESRGRPIPALAADYPDVAVLEVKDPPSHHPCVWLDTGEPQYGDRVHAYGYPKQGGSVRLTPVRLEYRGTQGASPTRYTDLMLDTVRPGMSGAAMLNLRTGGVSGIIVASRNPERDDGALAVPWSDVEESLGGVLAANHAFHSQDPAWAEAAQETLGRPGRMPDARGQADGHTGREDSSRPFAGHYRDLGRREYVTRGPATVTNWMGAHVFPSGGARVIHSFIIGFFIFPPLLLAQEGTTWLWTTFHGLLRPVK